MDVVCVENTSRQMVTEWIEARTGEGCYVKGKLHINKVAGNFHFALGKGVPNTAIGSSMSTDPFQKTLIGAQHQHRFVVPGWPGGHCRLKVCHCVGLI